MRKNPPGKVAIFGCGYWGKNLVRNFHQLGALGMVCDPSEDALRAACAIAPGVATATEFEAALRSDEVDAVAIATPAETHEGLAIRSMRAGKDVFVEKPMALHLEEGLRMRSESEREGRILMVGHLMEYHPAVRALRQLVSGGALGEVFYIYSNRLNFGKIRTEENALWSFAPHDIAVILRLAGQLPVEVTCVGGSYITPELADVTVSCLKFKNGMRAHIFVSWLNPFKEQKLVVVGERKMAVFNDVVDSGKLVLFDQRVRVNEQGPVLQKGENDEIGFDADEPLKVECRHFLDCVASRETPLTDASSGIEVLRVLEACQHSLQNDGNVTAVR
jgi:UDP-2-acetamido-3-amino-2,3-dideoxy-glucuronate N-acetyltransferase